MECPKCKHKNGLHNPACPKALGTPEAEAMYQRGREDGRAGRSKTEENPTYRLGYGNGVCALEEKQNGYDPRFA